MTTHDESPYAHPLASRQYLPWLLIVFAGSGCAALIYEVVWLQLLQLVIGSSGVSLGVLLGTFMGGMCLGSFLLPRLVPERVHPLRVWVYLELGIGIMGMAVQSGMPVIAGLYTHHLGHGILVRALVAAVCLMPPTLMMGATLPAIARWMETTSEGVSWMGFFYGGNIAGGVAGCLLAGFYLLRVYDMPRATYTAFAINVVVAAAGLILSSKAPRGAAPAARVPVRPVSPARISAVHLTIAISGLCALGAEVVWTRLLSLMLGATVYTFSIILAVFLIGLGLGSSLGAFVARTSARPRLALGVCQLMAAGAAAWAAFIIANSLPYWPINPSLATGEWGPWQTFQLDLLCAAWAVLPAAALWGASFPLALAAVASPGQDGGRMVGGIYAANTVGAIVGSLTFSMIVIPQAGTQWAQRWLILLSGISALVALVPPLMPGRRTKQPKDAIPPEPGSRIVWAVGILLAVVVVGFMAKGVSQVPWISIAWGRFSATYVAQAVPGVIPEGDVPIDTSGTEHRYCTYVGEGMNVSVAVTKSTAGKRYFHGAGKVQASSDPLDMRLQRMLGHLSALAHRNPDDVRDVLVVACGAGVTAGSFIPYPNVKRIVICDIEPLVPKVVAPMFARENYHIVDGIDKENPHMVNGKEVRVVYDDGRHYIRTLPKDEKFDVITSDPIDPWVKGSAALNTVEYYRMCKEHLKSGGIMSLWIPLYESNKDTAKSVIGTFFEAFPNGVLFSNDMVAGGYDAVLLGQVEPMQIDVDGLERTLDSDGYRPVKASLMEVGFGKGEAEGIEGSEHHRTAVDLLATYAGRPNELNGWMKDAQINTDSNLRLQYLAGMWLNSYIATAILNEILHYYRFPEGLFVGSPAKIEALKQALAEAGRRNR